MPTLKELQELEELDALEQRVKAQPPQEGFAEKAKNLAGSAAMLGRKALASGLGVLEGMARAQAELPTGPGLVTKLMRGLVGGGKPAIDKIDVPDDPNAGPAERYINAAVRGVGAAAALPIPGVGVLPQTATGIAGGVGGRAGGDYAKGISPKLEPYGKLLGALFGGGAMGWATGPKQPVAEQDIKKALKGMKQVDFDRAIANAREAELAGSKTHTAGEAFPEGSGVRALTDLTRNTTSNNPLKARTIGREEDLQGLGERFVQNIGAPVSPNKVANKAAGAANEFLAAEKSDRGVGIRNRLIGQNVTERQVTGLYDDLFKYAELHKLPGDKAALERVAKALVGSDGKPLTSVQDLSLAIKSLRSSAKNPNSPLFSGGDIDKTSLNNAIRVAEEHLGRISTPFKGAMDEFEAFSKGPMAATRQGPIGALSDRNPILAGQTPASKLEGLFNGNTPDEIAGVARKLDTPALTGGKPVSPLEIASAIAQQKLKKGPFNPGQAVRGNEGSTAEQQFEALLKVGGHDPKAVMAPLRVADRLQGNTGTPGINEAPRIGMGQMIRPFRSLDMLLTGHSQNKINQEVGKLLADPVNIPELQRIAMFNPQLRKALALQSVVTTGFSQNGEQ